MKKIIFIMSILVLCFYYKSFSDEIDLKRVLEASPYQEKLMSHFPIPIIFSDWENEVTNKYSKMSLAKFNENIYWDLPPCKAELDSVQKNTVLYSLIKTDSISAKKVILQALQSDTSLEQWSIIDACKDFVDVDFILPLINIAQNDPDKTNRAFAYKTLDKYKFVNKLKILREGLFDDYLSIRLLCMELLGRNHDKTADITALMPINPRNPFHFLFYDKAFERLFPDDSINIIIRLSFRERLNLYQKNNKKYLNEYIKLAEKFNNKSYSALVLSCFGDSLQKIQSIDRIEKILLEQGEYEDLFWSEDFWLRGDMMQTLSTTDTSSLKLIVSLISKHVSEYQKIKEQLLITFCYVFSYIDFKDCESAVVKIRDLEDAHPDLYLSAAKALTKQKSKEAFQSLINILADKQMPFFDQAINCLETLTNLETPGKPEDLGVLHKMGLPKEIYDYKKSIEFWENWYSKNKNKLYFDNVDGIFKIYN